MRQGITIVWSLKAIRDVRRLASRDRERVIAKIEQYAGSPESLANQVITLTGSKYRRLRVGGYRVVFSLERGEDTEILILRVRQ